MRLKTAIVAFGSVSATIVGTGILACGIYLWNWVDAAEEDWPAHLPRDRVAFTMLIADRVAVGQERSSALATLATLGLRDCESIAGAGVADGAPTLRCDRTRSGVLVHTHWTVLLTFQADRVARVDARFGQTGL